LQKPDNMISDYLTQFSGVSAGDLSGITTRLTDVQAKLLSLLTPNTILVGHSLENDMKALKLFHSRLIDTCVSFPHPRGPPFRSALRHLTKQHLGREIQMSDKGHCSQEDALATMELTQLKIKHGPAFADPKSQRVCEENSIVRELHASKLIEASTFIGPMEFLRVMDAALWLACV
jgi:RNA exonuclease 1